MAPPEKLRLGELLVRECLLTSVQLDAALARQKTSGNKLGRTLVDLGFVSEEQMCDALARQIRAPHVNLTKHPLQSSFVQLLSESQARRHRVLVLGELGDTLQIGMTDPTDLAAYDEIKRILRRELSIAVISESQLLTAIDRLYRRSGEISALSLELTAEVAQSDAEFASLSGNDGAIKDAPVAKLLQSIFEDAAQARASDIHIEPQESALYVRFRIDGVLHIQTKQDLRIAPALVQKLKLIAELDISEKRLPLDGRFAVDLRSGKLDVRISTLPTHYGEAVVMRLLSQNTGLLDIDRLGMPGHMVERLKHALSRSGGTILVTGPTGSGKTTTLYSSLAHINSTDTKILTVEDPIEYRLAGITQVQVHEKIDLTFARVLRAALRQDPDVILVGEMRDQTTAEIGMKAAMTGHLVLSTLHTNDAASTPIRLMDMGIAPYMVAMALNMVIAQRLVRVLCEECKIPAAPNAQQQTWLDAMHKRHGDGEASSAGTAGRTYYKGVGCPQCNSIGYSGRQAVYEMLEMTSALTEVANSGSAVDFVRLARQQIGRHTLVHNALTLAEAGRSTLDEAMRISAQMES